MVVRKPWKLPPRLPKQENLMLASTTLCLKKKSEGSKVTLDQSTALRSILMGKGRLSCCLLYACDYCPCPCIILVNASSKFRFIKWHKKNGQNRMHPFEEEHDKKILV